MQKGDLPFIGATDSNNGITNFVANKNGSLKSNVLGVNYNGSVVENFYHPYEAIYSDDVKQLEIKEYDAKKYAYLFLKAAILKQKSKYAYGYKFNAQRMKRQILMLPCDNEGNPAWDAMSNYMKAQELKLLKQYQEQIA